jgi:hypothetical protein
MEPKIINLSKETDEEVTKDGWPKIEPKGTGQVIIKWTNSDGQTKTL